MEALMNVMGTIGGAGMNVTPPAVQKYVDKFNTGLLEFAVKLSSSSMGLRGGEAFLNQIKQAAMSQQSLMVDGFLQMYSLYQKQIQDKDIKVWDELPVGPDIPSKDVSNENIVGLWAYLKKLRKTSLLYKRECSNAGHKSLGSLDVPEQISKGIKRIAQIFAKHKVCKDTFLNVLEEVVGLMPEVLELIKSTFPVPGLQDMKTQGMNTEMFKKVRLLLSQYLFPDQLEETMATRKRPRIEN